MAKLERRIRGTVVLIGALAVLAGAASWAQDQPAAATDSNPFVPKAGSTRTQLKTHLDKFSRGPATMRATPEFATGWVITAERLLEADPPESLRTVAVVNLLDALHLRASQDKNEEAEKKLAELAEKYAGDKDKRVANTAAIYVLEQRVLKSDGIGEADVPKLLDEVKLSLTGKTLNAKHVRMAEAVQKLINRLPTDAEAEKQFKEFGRLFAVSTDQTLSRLGTQFKTAKREPAPPATVPAAAEAATASSATPPPAAPEEIDWTGKPMELSGPTAGGEKFDIAQYKGKVVLVDFWATWCGPCRQLMPEVKATYEEFHDRGFEVVGVSVDNDLKALDEVIRDEKIPWVNVTGSKQDGKWGHPLAAKYQIRFIPTTFLVGKDGTIVATNVHGAALKAHLNNLLRDADASKTAQAN